MNKFSDNEVEIAVLTYNRSKILNSYLQKQLEEIDAINVKISIYDSSCDDFSEKCVENYQKQGYFVNYNHTNESLLEKYLDAIMFSTSKYIWIMGDSNYMDIPSFSERASIYIKDNYDVIIVGNSKARERENNEYTNPKDLFSECLWHMTWLGSLIVKREIYDLILNKETRDDIIDKSNGEYGSWYGSLGILFKALEKRKNMHAKVLSLGIYGLATIEKKQTWVKAGYKTWCEDLCLLVDSFGEELKENGNKALRKTWEELELDKNYWSCRFRAENALNRNIYENYKEKGYLDRVSTNVTIIERWACIPRTVAIMIYRVLKVRNWLKSRT